MKAARLLLSLAGLVALPSGSTADQNPPLADGPRVALVFRGGHETDPRDHGRPVVLIAAALGVPPGVFREAFSHVHPAPAGGQPEPDQVRKNKQALMERLVSYGVTNERLDEVSNYYRYRRESGELWRHVDAAGYAVVKHGKIVAITITEPGAGYSSPPIVSLPIGLTVYPLAMLSYGTNLSRNGSIAKIEQSAIGDDNKAPSMVPRSGVINFRTEEVPGPPPPPNLPPPAH